MRTGRRAALKGPVRPRGRFGGPVRRPRAQMLLSERVCCRQPSGQRVSQHAAPVGHSDGPGSVPKGGSGALHIFDPMASNCRFISRNNPGCDRFYSSSRSTSFDILGGEAPGRRAHSVWRGGSRRRRQTWRISQPASLPPMRIMQPAPLPTRSAKLACCFRFRVEGARWILGARSEEVQRPLIAALAPQNMVSRRTGLVDRRQ